MSKRSKLASLQVIDRTSSSVYQQTFFGIFWSLAMFFNGFRQGVHLNFGLRGFVTVFIFFCATLLFMKPSATGRLIVLCFFGVIDFYLRLPQMPNHFYILGLVNLTIVCSWIGMRIKNDFNKDWFLKIAPFLRLGFIFIYGAAALAKLNEGFFTPKTSCAYVLANREFEWMNIPIDFTRFGFFPHLISITELIIFFGLIFSRLRPYAVILASIFHTSLSLTPISQGLGFTFVLFGLLNLFVPVQGSSNVIKSIKIRQKKLDEKVPLDFFKLIYSFFALSIALIFLVVSRNHLVDRGLRWLFSLIVLSILAAGISYISFLSRKEKFEKPFFGISGFVQILVFIIIFVTSVSPYIGLKTRPTFTMFSNLKVEGNSTNHLFIPRLIHDNFADDLVTIQSSSNTELQQDAQNGVKWVYLELQRKLQIEPNTAITYIRNGVKFELKRASDNPDLINPNPVLLKLLSFRKVHSDNTCLW